MNFIAFTVLRFGLFLLYALVTSPLVGGLYLLGDCVNSHESLHDLRWILAFPSLGWLLGVGWMAQDTAKHMFFEAQSFDNSIRLSLYAARFHLSFLPIVGHWFMSADRRNDDENHEN